MNKEDSDDIISVANEIITMIQAHNTTDPQTIDLLDDIHECAKVIKELAQPPQGSIQRMF
jgi:hypothetical protein